MKWLENGIECEGTPEEYARVRALTSGNGGTETGRKPHVYVNPVRGRAVRCTGSAGYRNFISAKLACNYVRQLTGVDVGYSTFCHVAKSGGQIDGVKVEYVAPARGETVQDKELVQEVEP